MKSTFSYLCILLLTGCIQNGLRETKIPPHQSVQQPEPIKISTESDLDKVIDETILDSRFSIQQKTSLDNLRSELNGKLKINGVINLKLRAQLFNELLSPTYSNIEVQLIQEMLQRNSFERTSLILQSIEITNVITGRTEISTAAEHLRRETFIVY